MENSEKVPCGCGRSPTGECLGWHSLTQEHYELLLAKYREQVYDTKPREE